MSHEDIRFYVKQVHNSTEGKTWINLHDIEEIYYEHAPEDLQILCWKLMSYLMTGEVPKSELKP